MGTYLSAVIILYGADATFLRGQGWGYGRELDATDLDQWRLNIALQVFAANYWLTRGAPADKLNIGLPLYGRTFTLLNPAKRGVGAAAKGGGKSGKYTQEEGYMAFYEVYQYSFSFASNIYIYIYIYIYFFFF